MAEKPHTVHEMKEGVQGSLTLEYLTSINYSMYHNHNKTLIKCEINNDSDTDWHNLSLTVSGTLLRTRTTAVDTVKALTRVDVTDNISIDVDPEQLLQLSESINTEISIKVEIGQETVLELVQPLQLMPYDQWCGIEIRPELLASFVTPNHPILSRVAAEASKFMLRFTGSSDLDEYMSQDPNRVRAQVASVYEALRSENLIYASAPASFESTGQRVRTVDKVLDEKLGTCLDLSLLAASCLESLGINPLLILTKGHCMVGAWLVKDSYTHATGDDPEYLLKSAADGINEIVIFESTMLTNNQNVSFDQAVEVAMDTLRHSEFMCFIDVYRARVSGVRPLPLRIKGDEGWKVQNTGIEHTNATTEVKEYDRYDLTNYAADSVKLTKYSLWERKLLDFSLRNNLLSMRLGRKIIPMVSFGIDQLEDRLQEGGTFQVHPFPLDTAASAPDKGIYDSSKYVQLRDFIIKELNNKKIYSFQGATELKDALKYVYRASRTSMEENGANNLYLVLGILKWHETERSQQPRYAPILLLPIEIVRCGGVAGYVIRARDEETVLNITLVELLKQQYGIDLSLLDELPKDQSGVDVKKIFAIVREKIRHNKGWNVLDEAMIGLFSFNKFVMWNDIHSNAAKLQDNEIISSLVDGKLNVTGIDHTIDAKEADSNSEPGQFTIPIDVDSSQLEAVIASGAGQSFILHGPPGTGKSQTITNMIANALYQGKRVLFVAEKMAALSVVQARLQKIGLAPFCLELHSNKVTKRHFLAQMEAALDVTHTKTQAEYKRASDDLYALRCQLISYIEALHAPASNGFSLYECITRYLSLDGDAIDPDPKLIQTVDAQNIGRYQEEIASLDTVFSLSGAPADSLLHDIELKDGSIDGERMLKEQLQALQRAIDDWNKGCALMVRCYGVSVPDSMKGIDWATSYIRILTDMPCCTGQIIRLCIDSRLVDMLVNAVKGGATAARCRQDLARAYTPAVLQLRSDALSREWQEANSKWALPRYFACRSVLKKMQAYKPGFNENDLNIVIRELSNIENCQRQYDTMANQVQQLFGSAAHYQHERWGDIYNTLQLMPELYALASELARTEQIPPTSAIDMMARGFTGKPQPTDYWPQMIQAGQEIKDILQRVNRVAHIPQVEENITVTLSEMSSRWLKGLPDYRDWYRWCKSQRELRAQHLDSVINYIVEGRHSGASAAKAFAKGLYKTLAQEMIDRDEKLRYFNGKVFNDTIEKYRKLTARFQQLSMSELYCRLAANIPSQVMAAHENSEIGILKRNIKNGGRGTSIRKIIDQIPTLLPKLTPCMLMSPLSVAQYISIDNDKFDIVIFDEASQMPTSEAVGAIARGKSLIVVGDPKQMPPTSFFATSAVGEEEAYIDDMESILDDCISLSMPSKYLTWHYRSKHESLISFSNSQYYDGRLYTFPSIDDQKSRVTMREVQGVYDKGKTRSNVTEARAVVDEVMRRLSDPELSKQSIGIVSFSKVQQDKIEDLLTDELAKHHDLEAIAYNEHEPIFIKNLENVQGDERDVILFSIGYGPDANGKVSMNFGPLNNAGGERRLNVAVSRARREMVVFSSLKSEQIDLRRTNALGVMGLKKFLEYAESGNNITIQAQNAASDDDVITTEIAQMLHEQGFETKCHIGRSQFKVDIAVIDPDDSTKFIFGILLDGQQYYSTKTVRDREVVQPTVLRMLGWDVMRVWTLDWYERRDDVTKSILAKIKEAKRNRDRKPATAPAPELIKQTQYPEPQQRINKPVTVTTPPSKDYVTAVIDQTPGTIEQMETSRSLIKRQLLKLITAEQPITSGLINKRIVKLWGLSRVSPRLQALVSNLLSEMDIYKSENGDNGSVYWTTEGNCQRFNKYRVGSDRDIQDVPYIEIANAMRWAIDQQVAIESDDLKRLTANLLGYTRKGSNIENFTEYTLATLAAEGYVSIQGSKVVKI